MYYIQTGTGGGTHRLINITGAASIEAIATSMFMITAVTDDNVIGIDEDNFVVGTMIFSSRLIIIRNGGVITGDTIAYYANGTSAQKAISNCFLSITNGTSGGDATIIETAGNGCDITLESCILASSGFTNNYKFNGAAGDTIYSFFAINSCAQGNTGAATYHEVGGKRTTGDLEISRDILLGRNIEIAGTLELASGTTANEISTDGTLGGDSDDAIPTEKAVKTYTDTTLGDYTKKDGTVAFTGTVAGITPTDNADLATKAYVDGVGGGGGGNDLGPFVDKDLVTSPAPVIDNKYIMAGNGGNWGAGAVDDVATCTDDGPETWTFETPVAGKHGWVTDEAIDYTFNGAAWATTGTTISHLSLQDIGTNAHSAIDTHIANVTTNPHSVDKTDLSLNNVTNDSQLKRAADDFDSFAAKTSQSANDLFLIEDSDDAGAKKKIAASNILDNKVKVSSNDTVNDYLINKLIGTASTFVWTEVGDGGEEDLRLDYGTELTTLTDGSVANGLHIHLSQDYHFFADQLDSPDNADWAVNSLARAFKDTNNNALTIREFDDTSEEGVGFMLEIPTGATNIIISLRSRAETAAGANLDVVPKLYVREMPDNGVVEAWSAGTDMTTITMGTGNEYFQYDTQTIALATLGLVVGRLAQFELTRNTGSGSDTLVGDWTLLEIKVGFS